MAVEVGESIDNYLKVAAKYLSKVDPSIAFQVRLGEKTGQLPNLYLKIAYRQGVDTSQKVKELSEGGFKNVTQLPPNPSAICLYNIQTTLENLFELSADEDIEKIEKL